MKKQENKKIWIGEDLGSHQEIEEKKDVEIEAVKPPPLKEQLVSFAKAFTGWVSQGAKIVTPKEYMGRLTLCHTCDSYDEPKDRCNQCGCKVQLKARMATSECPLKKWESDGKK